MVPTFIAEYRDDILERKEFTMHVPYRLSRSRRREQRGTIRWPMRTSCKLRGKLLGKRKKQTQVSRNEYFLSDRLDRQRKNICSTKKLYRSRNHDIEHRSNEKRLIGIVRRSFPVYLRYKRDLNPRSIYGLRIFIFDKGTYLRRTF